MLRLGVIQKIIYPFTPLTNSAFQSGVSHIETLGILFFE